MEHTDRELGQQLEDLRSRLLRMAGVVENMIGDAVRALLERDVTLAAETIRNMVRCTSMLKNR